jgi:hypothetical protein
MGQYVTYMTMQGVLARSGGVGVMGHLGHIAIAEKLLAYNIAYSNCIQFTFFIYYYLT